MTAPPLQGVLVIDKPIGPTSFDVVQVVRRALGVKKAGHTGTLDPLATGVLPICVGEATKIAGLLTAEDKEYLARARLGQETDSLDTDGRVVAQADPRGVTREAVEVALAGLTGVQQQVPPAFSAIRQGGERAYERARRGEEVELAPREVTVHRLALTAWEPPELAFEVTCSKGTFVRSIVRDLGRQLGCGAVLTALRRTRSGAFDLGRAVPLDALAERARAGQLPLLGLDQALAHLAAVELDADAVRRVRQGQPVDGAAPAGQVLRLRAGGSLVALGELREGRVWPTRVFAAE